MADQELATNLGTIFGSILFLLALSFFIYLIIDYIFLLTSVSYLQVLGAIVIYRSLKSLDA